MSRIRSIGVRTITVVLRDGPFRRTIRVVPTSRCLLQTGNELCLDIAQSPGPTECKLIVSWVDGRGNTSRWVGAISRR